MITVKATIYTNYGRPEEESREVYVLLGEAPTVYQLGEVTWQARP